MKKSLAVILAAALTVSGSVALTDSVPTTDDGTVTAANRPAGQMPGMNMQSPNIQMPNSGLSGEPVSSETGQSTGSQWYLERTNSHLLWDLIEDEQDETIYVAVLDTGVDYSHPDLKNRVDEDLGYDFVNDDDDPMDDNGHGTHLAGIIGAEADNGEGITGITGNLDVVIIPIKILDAEGSGEIDDVVDGIEYAREQGADIINLSFGSSDLPDSDIEDLEEAIENAVDDGVFVVAAAGNEGEDCEDYMPAALDDVFTVTSSGTNNLPSSFSNLGDPVEVMAPGESIISTYLNGQYAEQDGTSMATPIAAGIAAMLLAYDEDLSVDDLADCLNGGANYLDIYDDMNLDGKIGYGLIDAAGAYEDLTGEDIYDEDVYIEILETVTGNPTNEAPTNMAPNMNIRSMQPNVNRRR